jgi:hypothetical protein
MPRRVAQGYLIWKSRRRLIATLVITTEHFRTQEGSVVMTDVENGARKDSRSGRISTIACLLAVVPFFVTTVTSSPAQEDASIMKSITVDCSAFKKEADGTWTTSRQSVLTGPGGSASGPVLSFPGLNLELLRPYGVNMIDLLNARCGPSRKQPAAK